MKKLFIMILAFVIVFINHNLGLVETGGKKYPSTWDTIIKFKKSSYQLKQQLSLIKEANGKVDYSSNNELAKQFLNYISVNSKNDVKYLKNSEKFEYFEIPKQELIMHRLLKYENKPIITNPENTSFIFYKTENNCQYVDAQNIENSDCLIIVDTNGYKKKPNRIKYRHKKESKTDRYYFIVDGKNDKIVLPNKYRHFLQY